jgi:hypothetical protein
VGRNVFLCRGGVSSDHTHDILPLFLLVFTFNFIRDTATRCTKKNKRRRKQRLRNRQSNQLPAENGLEKIDNNIECEDEVS